ncbi:MAG: TonB family protein [Pseudomonadota bacterium]
MELGRRHIFGATIFAIVVHLAVAAAVFWTPLTSGATGAGVGGLDISLGAAGGAPGLTEPLVPQQVLQEQAERAEEEDIPEPTETAEPTETEVAPPEQTEVADVESPEEAEVEPIAEETPPDVIEEAELDPVTEEAPPELLQEPTAEPVTAETAELTPVEDIEPVLTEPEPIEPQETPEEVETASVQPEEVEPPEVTEAETVDGTVSRRPRARPREFEVPERQQAQPQPQPEPEPRRRPAETASSSGEDADEESTNRGQGTANNAGDARENTGDSNANSAGGNPGAKRDYAARIQAILAQNKRYPRRAQSRRQEGTGQLYFVVRADGAVSGIRLQSSSGHAILDDEILAILRRVGALPPFPADLGVPQLELVVPITFDLR